MPKRSVPSRFRPILDLLLEKSPENAGFFARWAVLAGPGLAVWAYHVPAFSAPGRSGWTGAVVILSVAAWYARTLPRLFWFGMLTGIGLAAASTAVTAWAAGQNAWVAWAVFFAASIGTSFLQDGRLALALWTALWVAASNALPSVWWSAVLFAVFPPPVRVGRSWARWGAAAAALGLWVLAASRGDGGTFFLGFLGGLQEWLVTRGYLVPVLLTWLGVSFVEKRSFLPWWAAQAVGWTLAWGWAGFQGVPWLSSEVLGLLWLAGTGFGLASLCRDLLDRSWHAQLLWASLALVLWTSF